MIDFHAHVGIPEAEEIARNSPGWEGNQAALARRYRDPATAAHMASVASEWDRRLTDPEERIRFMDDAGISTQIVSVNPGQYHYWMGEADSAELVGRVNAQLARIVESAPPNRLLGLATVSLQHPELAATQLERAVERDGLVGVQISTSAGGRDLADPAFDGLWSAAERLDVAVFVHPLGCPQLTDRLAPSYLNNVVGQPLETTIALSLLIFSGVLDRHPGLRICAAHGGGYLPHYLGRGDHAWGVRPDSRTMAHPPRWYLRGIYVDSLVHSAEVLTNLLRTMGPDRVVVGTDYPFDMGETDPASAIGAVRHLTAEQRHAIAVDNALRLLGPRAAGRHS
ncbi:amidohydrolase family protein [Acrocarpospora sp. B8E8]|uniref:amidohydrolase family protein n=1 Tax=Acrocarpospora sp. B8E8 TaxID=3153572 RepID=UPI00325F58BB